MVQPFHAGGGAAGHLIFDPWYHGTGVLRAVLTRWSELDVTQAGSLIAIAGTAPAVWQLLRHAWHETYGWIRQFFLASVTIPGGDPLNRSIVQWIQNNRPRHDRIFTGRTEVHSDHTDRAAALKKTRRSVQYSPYWVTRWFLYANNVFIASRAIENISSAISNESYDGFGGDDITISCFGRSPEPIMKLIEECREYADRQTQYYVIIYSRDRYGLAWKPKSRTPIRLLETVHFDDRLKQELVADIKTYLDPRTQRRYASRSMPYRRGFLFYGPPGTGKTSLTTALAGEFGLDLYEVKIPSVQTDADLEQMFQEIPPQCIVLLEDIDAVWTDRSPRISDTRPESSSSQSNCTLSGLLNVLDGVGSQEGRIVIMTTNKPELLDSALVRPGRVDMRVFLGNITQKSAEQMFTRMFTPELGVATELDLDDIEQLAKQFAKEVPEDTFTPSQLQGFFQLHLDSATKAAASISSWVEKEISRGDRDFEVVTTDRKL